MQTYQEYLFFLNRYKHLVYTQAAKNLFSYVVYPLNNAKENEKTRGPQDNYNDYDREDMKRFKIDGKLVIPDGPYKIETYHIFRPGLKDPVIEKKKFGPSQLENFAYLIEQVTNTQFPKLIDQYASKDCDFRFACIDRDDVDLGEFKYFYDCSEALTKKLKVYWKLD